MAVQNLIKVDFSKKRRIVKFEKFIEVDSTLLTLLERAKRLRSFNSHKKLIDEFFKYNGPTRENIDMVVKFLEERAESVKKESDRARYYIYIADIFKRNKEYCECKNAAKYLFEKANKLLEKGEGKGALMLFVGAVYFSNEEDKPYYKKVAIEILKILDSYLTMVDAFLIADGLKRAETGEVPFEF